MLKSTKNKFLLASAFFVLQTTRA